MSADHPATPSTTPEIKAAIIRFVSIMEEQAAIQQRTFHRLAEGWEPTPEDLATHDAAYAELCASLGRLRSTLLLLEWPSSTTVQ